MKDLDDDDECRTTEGNILEDNMTVPLLDASLGLTALCLTYCMHCAFSLPQKIVSSALNRVALTNKEIHNVSHVA